MVVTTNGSQIKRTETISQLKKDISEFYQSFKKKYFTLRHKHIKEHKELRRLNDDRYGTGKRPFVIIIINIIIIIVIIIVIIIIVTSFDYSLRQKIVYL